MMYLTIAQQQRVQGLQSLAIVHVHKDIKYLVSDFVRQCKERRNATHSETC